nr:MAG TPA: hypothetical protein [Caudoviricetes sp.]
MACGETDNVTCHENQKPEREPPDNGGFSLLNRWVQINQP